MELSFDSMLEGQRVTVAQSFAGLEFKFLFEGREQDIEMKTTVALRDITSLVDLLGRVISGGQDFDEVLTSNPMPLHCELFISKADGTRRCSLWVDAPGDARSVIAAGTAIIGMDDVASLLQEVERESCLLTGKATVPSFGL